MILRFLNWWGCWIYRIKHGKHCRCERGFGPAICRCHLGSSLRLAGVGPHEKVRRCGGCGRVLHSQVEAVVGPYFRERDAVDRILIEGALQNLFREGR